jgi:hypothetical protein
LLALQASIAAPDVAILSARARDVLALPPASIAPLAREQALVAAMLAAIVAGHPRDVAGLEAGDGRTIAPSNEFGTLRSWLLAWADGAQAGSGTHR